MAEGFGGLYEEEVLKFLRGNPGTLQQVIATSPIITAEGGSRIAVSVPPFDPPSFKYDLPAPEKEAEDRCLVSVSALRQLACEALGLTTLPGSLFYQPQIETMVFETVVQSAGLPGKVHGRQTAEANMLRNALRTGKAYYGGLREEDIYRVPPTIGYARQSKAVVLALGITSNSTAFFLPFIRRSTYCGALDTLAGPYDQTEIVFITQSKNPQEVDEDRFFTPGQDIVAASGPSYSFASSLLDRRYQGYDAYAFMFALENMLDTEEAGQSTASLRELVGRCKAVGLARVGEYITDYSTAADRWKTVTDNRLVVGKVKKKEDAGMFLRSCFIAARWQERVKQ